MFRYDDVTFRYEPFPVGTARNLVEPSLYAELCATFPEQGRFEHQTRFGDRYVLSTASHEYGPFLRRNRAWSELHRWLMTRAFVAETKAMFAAHHIDLGMQPLRLNRRRRSALFLRDVLRGNWPSADRVRVELIFSTMAADGGFLLPHTDSPEKIVNIAFAIAPKGEWTDDFGGATEIERPNDPRQLFNWNNRRLPFEEVSSIDRIPFTPNQGVVVVKTFNSWHSVRPMHGPAAVYRRSINVNILRY